MKPFYALLANGLTTALAGPTGAVDWWPVPRFDGPTIFSRLLDHHAGGYLSLEPEGYTTVTQRYRPEGLFLETHFECPGGFATITTGLEVGRNALWLTANSTVPLVLTCRPSFDYGVVRPSFVPLPHGMRFINPVGPGQAALIIQGPAELMSRMDQWRCGPGRLTVVFRVLMEAKPDWRWLSAPVPTDADRIWAKSSAFWALPTAAQDTEEPIRRSLLIIKGLTFRPTGAPVAAATTSLPEAPGESRQWDYRYVWVRDSAYSGESLLLTGNVVEAKRTSFLPRSTGGIPDAALLTLPLYGFVSVHNPYFINTLKIIESTLVDNGLVYRYRADDLGKARFPFLLVGFWYARVLLRQGRHEEAQHVIERHLAQATPLGLYGEHADEQTGTVRGNFPQLFSHSALVTTLMEQKFLAQGRPLPEYALLTATKLMG
ncbi:glycoside hydrolase family 15 protein [Sulfobacillus thermotolerans]|uniref:glycoside hydrolase family 15 protein n=1 Tax=Sulfobacillus thermotolerans TaxID=338644 RepID=UPI00336868E5